MTKTGQDYRIAKGVTTKPFIGRVLAIGLHCCLEGVSIQPQVKERALLTTRRITTQPIVQTKRKKEVINYTRTMLSTLVHTVEVVVVMSAVAVA